MLTFQSTEISAGLMNVFVLPESAFIYRIFHLDMLNSVVRGFSMLIFVVAGFGICLVPENNYRKLKERNGWVALMMSTTAFLWSFICLSSESKFVYFNF